MAKKKSKSKKKSARSTKAPDTTGKHLVIVESPTKAKTINKYLGSDYVVMASVGHVRDLPKSPPKGAKRKDHPVPGVDLEHDFKPTYEVMPDKKKTITELKKAAKKAADVWFATDLDREGEAIAWHLAQALDQPTQSSKRVVFNAITRSEVEHAFSNPRPIDQDRVDAQQARRILDRIVGYQVSPLLWKKVAGGLSAGRVQSVAVRLVVEREREIDAFIPTESWKVTAYLTPELSDAAAKGEKWRTWLNEEDEPRTNKEKTTWLNEQSSFAAELVQIQGKKFTTDNRDDALSVAQKLGFEQVEAIETQDPKAKGPAQNRVSYISTLSSDAPPFRIASIEKKRTKSRPGAPFITSTMQQAAANRLGFALQRAMRVAQQLYEGIDLGGGRGQTGLITYMRTDSTHLSREAIDMVRSHIGREYGDKYLPEKPNFYSSSNKDAQEAHEAIRPTDVSITPDSIRSRLTEEQYKLYRLIWQRFVSCQMVPAEWDNTTLHIEAGEPAIAQLRASGRTLAFEGFYRVTGVPNQDGEPILPALEENQPLAPLQVDPTQHFSSPPPRYTEASLQKKLEEEGIGRPSTYAAIIQTIQDRKYVEPYMPRDRRLRATDLGMVVTDKLMEGFPKIMDVAYTREMEAKLDQIEESHKDWVEMLREFYGPFRKNLETAHESMTHAKAETEPAPHICPKCGSGTMYRFGKNGRFLSCASYPDCDYAAPIDREGNPKQPELTDILCPEDGQPMIKRTGRFGPFLASSNYPQVKYIVKLDPKKGHVVLPKTPPMMSDITCPKCEEHNLYVRDSKRGLWLSCSNFPKCRGRVAFSKLEEAKQKEIEKAWQQHQKENPVPEIRTAEGHVIQEDEQYIPKVEEAADASTENKGYGSDAA